MRLFVYVCLCLRVHVHLFACVCSFLKNVPLVYIKGVKGTSRCRFICPKTETGTVFFKNLHVLIYTYDSQ